MYVRVKWMKQTKHKKVNSHVFEEMYDSVDNWKRESFLVAIVATAADEVCLNSALLSFVRMYM